MAEDNNKTWQVACSSEQFDKLRGSGQFHSILTLARIVNSLRFAQVSLVFDGDKADTPSASRQRVSSFLYSAALIWESLKFVDTLGKHFRQHASYQNGFAKLLQDSEVRNLRQGVLQKMRNMIVFHLDKNVVPESLATLDLDRYVFVTGRGSRTRDAYYELADRAIVHWLLGTPTDGTDFEEEFRSMVGQVTALITRYSDAADDLIAEVVPSLGFELHE